MLYLNDMSNFNVGHKPEALNETVYKRMFSERYF